MRQNAVSAFGNGGGDWDSNCGNWSSNGGNRAHDNTAAARAVTLINRNARCIIFTSHMKL